MAMSQTSLLASVVTCDSHLVVLVVSPAFAFPLAFPLAMPLAMPLVKLLAVT